MTAWAWIWTLWLLAIVVSFSLLEGLAIVEDGMTLSRFVWKINNAFPVFGFICGLIVGFLACHFWYGGQVSFAPMLRKLGVGQ